MTTERPTRDELLARAKKPAEDALRLHPFYRGKIQTALKCPALLNALAIVGKDIRRRRGEKCSPTNGASVSRATGRA